MAFRALGQPLPETERLRVRDLIVKLGERRAAQVFGVDAKTLLRCAAGIGVYRGTAALVRETLARKDAA